MALSKTRLLPVYTDDDEDRRTSWASFSIGKLGWYTFARGDTGKYPVAPRIERLDDLSSGEFVAVWMPLAQRLLEMDPTVGSPHPQGGKWSVARVKQLYDWQEELSEFLEAKRGETGEQSLWGDCSSGCEPPNWDTMARWYIINFLAQTQLMPIPVYATKSEARTAFEIRCMQLQTQEREREREDTSA